MYLCTFVESAVFQCKAVNYLKAVYSSVINFSYSDMMTSLKGIIAERNLAWVTLAGRERVGHMARQTKLNDG